MGSILNSYSHEKFSMNFKNVYVDLVQNQIPLKGVCEWLNIKKKKGL